MQFLQQNRHWWHHFTDLSIAVDDKMVAKIFSSQNKSSSSERDSLPPFQYALDSVQYAVNIARLLQCKVNGHLFRYIIMI